MIKMQYNGLKTLPHRALSNPHVSIWLLIIGLSLQVTPVKAVETQAIEAKATDWLQRMQSALKTQSVEGHFVHIIGEKMRSIHYRHAFLDNTEYERITQLNGPMAEIIRQGDQIICVFPDKSKARLHQAQQQTSPLQRSIHHTHPSLSTHYHISHAPGGRVAGLNTIKIDFKPKDAHRLAYQFWLEQQHALLLKSNITNQKGGLLEKFEFTRFTLNPKLHKSDFSIATQPHDAQVVIHSTQPSAPPKQTKVRWQINWLPAGFIRTNKRIVSETMPQDNVTMHTYSDGIAAFSVFLEAIPHKNGIPKQEQMLPSTRQGATLSTSQLYPFPPDLYIATLVGEIPIDTARTIIESLELKPHSH